MIDESLGALLKRLCLIGVESTLANRLAWRGLPTNGPGFDESISGAILYDETFWQSSIAAKPSSSSSTPLIFFQASESTRKPWFRLRNLNEIGAEGLVC